MKRMFLSFIIVCISLVGFGQEFSLKPTETSNVDYTSITFLSEGETYWLESNTESEKGFAFRAVITTSEIYDNLFVEEVGYGEERGGKKILKRIKIDLNTIMTNLKLKGEISGVEFVKWLTWNSFVIKLQNVNIEIRDIDHVNFIVKG